MVGFEVISRLRCFEWSLIFNDPEGKQALQLDIDDDVFRDDEQFDQEAFFVKQWRSDLIERTLTRLQAIDQTQSSRMYEVLSLRIASSENAVARTRRQN